MVYLKEYSNRFAVTGAFSSFFPPAGTSILPISIIFSVISFARSSCPKSFGCKPFAVPILIVNHSFIGVLTNKITDEITIETKKRAFRKAAENYEIDNLGYLCYKIPDKEEDESTESENDSQDENNKIKETKVKLQSKKKSK